MSEKYIDLIVENLCKLQLEKNSITRPIAFGFPLSKKSSPSIWFVMQFEQETISKVEILEIKEGVDSLNLDDALGVDVAIFANKEIWSEIASGGMDAAMRICDEQKITVSGKLAYFICHVRSIVNAILLFAGATSFAET